MKGTGSGSHHQKHVEVLTQKNKGGDRHLLNFYISSQVLLAKFLQIATFSQAEDARDIRQEMAGPQVQLFNTVKVTFVTLC